MTKLRICAEDVAQIDLSMLFQELDTLLTGKNINPHQRPVMTPEAIFERSDNIYYLSDGGYSRIGIADFGTSAEEDIGTLFLTSNSRQEVQDRWDLPEVVLVREKIEKVLKEYAKQMLD